MHASQVVLGPAVLPVVMPAACGAVVLLVDGECGVGGTLLLQSELWQALPAGSAAAAISLLGEALCCVPSVLAAVLPVVVCVCSPRL